MDQPTNMLSIFMLLFSLVYIHYIFILLILIMILTFMYIFFLFCKVMISGAINNNLK